MFKAVKPLQLLKNVNTKITLTYLLKKLHYCDKRFHEMWKILVSVRLSLLSPCVFSFNKYWIFHFIHFVLSESIVFCYLYFSRYIYIYIIIYIYNSNNIYIYMSPWIININLTFIQKELKVSICIYIYIIYVYII